MDPMKEEQGSVGGGGGRGGCIKLLRFHDGTAPLEGEEKSGGRGTQSKAHDSLVRIYRIKCAARCIHIDDTFPEVPLRSYAQPTSAQPSIYTWAGSFFVLLLRAVAAAPHIVYKCYMYTCIFRPNGSTAACSDISTLFASPHPPCRRRRLNSTAFSQGQKLIIGGNMSTDTRSKSTTSFFVTTVFSRD